MIGTYPMQNARRKLVLTLLALPAGCAIQPLPALRSEPAPAPAGSPLIRPPAVGQRWTYRKYNSFNSTLLANETHEVTALQPQVVIRHRSDAAPADREERQQPWGQVLREPGWDRAHDYEQALPLWPTDLSPGARSEHRTHYRLDGESFRYWLTAHTTVRGWERVTLGPQTHLALRIDRFIRLDHHDVRRQETTRHESLWLVPEIGRWVAREISGEYLVTRATSFSRDQEDRYRWELSDWS